MSPFRVIVSRASNEETTFAIVECEPNQKIMTSAQLRDAITRAVSRWVRFTPEGKEAWEESDEDFNIGDLVNEPYENGPLAEFLEEEGVRCLKIDVYSEEPVSQDWLFDNVLVHLD